MFRSNSSVSRMSTVEVEKAYDEEPWKIDLHYLCQAVLLRWDPECHQVASIIEDMTAMATEPCSSRFWFEPLFECFQCIIGGSTQP